MENIGTLPDRIQISRLQNLSGSIILLTEQKNIIWKKMSEAARRPLTFCVTTLAVR